jgi:hypothetical protein
MSRIEELRIKKDELEESLLEEMQKQTMDFEKDNGISVKSIDCDFIEGDRRMTRPWVRYGLSFVKVELENI